MDNFGMTIQIGYLVILVFGLVFLVMMTMFSDCMSFVLKGERERKERKEKEKKERRKKRRKKKNRQKSNFLFSFFVFFLFSLSCSFRVLNENRLNGTIPSEIGGLSYLHLMFVFFLFFFLFFFFFFFSFLEIICPLFKKRKQIWNFISQEKILFCFISSSKKRIFLF